jgi:hypothetical protein
MTGKMTFPYFDRRQIKLSTQKKFKSFLLPSLFLSSNHRIFISSRMTCRVCKLLRLTLSQRKLLQLPLIGQWLALLLLRKPSSLWHSPN